MSDMMSDMISVIIPIFNSENYLDKCLSSVINQSYRNLEIILIDDGSTDNSSKICDKYAAIDNRIIVVHKKNEGVSKARNLGIDLATGQYISFIDSDDWLETEMLKVAYNEIIQKDKEYDMVIYGHYIDKPKSNTSRRSNIYHKSILSAEEAIRLALTSEYFQGYLWNKLFKSSIIKNEIRLYFDEDIYIYEDLLFVCRYLLRSYNIKISNNHLYHYTIHENSAVRNKFNKKKFTAITSLNNIKEFCIMKIPSLNDDINAKLVKTNIYLLINMINTNYSDHDEYKLIQNTIIENYKSLNNKNLISIKEKIYVNIISINPYLFKIGYRVIRLLNKLMKRG